MKITLEIPEEISTGISFCFIGINENNSATIKSATVLLAGHNEDTLIVEVDKPCYWESEEV